MARQRFFQLNLEDCSKISKIIKHGGQGRHISRAIVLKMKDKGYTNIEAAEMAEVTPRTVINICNYYEQGGLDAALNDDPRPGQPPKFDARIKSKIVAMVCSDPPQGFDRWTLDLLKEQVEDRKIVDKISGESLRLILREHDLKPWQYKMWCVPDLSLKYIERMERILNLYEKPYSGKNPVICLDEKPVTLLGDKRDKLPFSEGKPNRVDYEYSRNGSVNVFCAVEPLKGVYFNQVTEFKKKPDFARFLNLIYERYKYSEKIYLVMDNYSTHFKSALLEKFEENTAEKIWRKFEIYYTPVHASWLNQAEIAIGIDNHKNLATFDLKKIPFTLFLSRDTFFNFFFESFSSPAKLVS